jgi:hypothetical protein
MVAGTSSNVFINELYYDNAGGDVGEFVEIANTTGIDLTGWSVVLYNGSDGTEYGSATLTGSAQFAALAVSEFGVTGIQNGAPDGVALIDLGGNVVQFLFYEGSFTATDGPANGATSTDIGVAETSWPKPPRWCRARSTSFRSPPTISSISISIRPMATMM